MGLRIAAERDSRGWTQRELGRRAGLSSSRLSRLERGRCTARLGELAELREVLGIDLDELVFGRPPGSADNRLAGLARRLGAVGTRTEIELIERLMECLLHLPHKEALA
jgi:transcriptional regulator with XRE-family HTH domain